MGLGQTDITTMPIFRLHFSRLWATMQGMGEVLLPYDDESVMTVSLANFFWFYFSPRGRGVGGGV